MLVYGDRSRTVDPRRALTEIGDLLQPGWQDQLTRALIEAGELAQGVADFEFEASGHDDVSDAQAAAMALTVAIARRLLGDAKAGAHEALKALKGQRLPASLRCRTPEGYAFYAVSPAASAAPAADHPWAGRPLVIGLRSIGTSLAAVVAAALNGEAISLRPVGAPFRREARASQRLRARLQAHPGPFVVVDEGPGLSGSSFGCVADLLEDLGVAPERIIFMPSHAGDLGPEASPRHRTRWSGATRLVRTLDDLTAGSPLPSWFEGEVGLAEAAEDLSAGAWRKDWGEAPRPPATPTLERRKIRFRTQAGVFVARFAGLGRLGEAKFERARALHGAGFGPEPMALRNGFLLERWIAGRPLDLSKDRAHVLRRLGDYLAFRADRFPASAEDGADVSTLREMASENTAALCGSAVAAQVDRLVQRLESSRDDLRRVHVDGRLHSWEWRLGPDGACKLDGLDHSCGHDLVGAQEITWDLAGAVVEFGLTASEAQVLTRRLQVSGDRLVPLTACYAAFQAGLWFMRGQADEPGDDRLLRRRLASYRDRLHRLATLGE